MQNDKVFLEKSFFKNENYATQQKVKNCWQYSQEYSSVFKVKQSKSSRNIK